MSCDRWITIATFGAFIVALYLMMYTIARWIMEW